MGFSSENPNLELELAEVLYKTFAPLFNRCHEGNRLEINIMADVIVDINITGSAPPQPLAVDLTGVPGTAQQGVPYSGVIKPTGGTPPYTFTDVSVANGETGFAPGLALNADGTITGTPTDGSNTAAVVDVGDSAGATAQIRARVGAKK